MEIRTTARAAGAAFLTTVAALASLGAVAPATAAQPTAVLPTADPVPAAPTLLLADISNGGRILETAGSTGSSARVVSNVPQNPFDVAYGGGKILVADSSGALLGDADGANVASVASLNPSGWGAVHGVAMDDAGTAYVGDEFRTPSILVQTRDGARSSRTTQQIYAHDIAVAKDGTLYVATFDNGIWKVSPSGSAALMSFSGPAAPGYYGVALSADEQTLYMTDQSQVTRSAVSGGAVTVVTNPGRTVADLAVGADGTLYMASTNAVLSLAPGSSVPTTLVSDPSWFLTGLDVKGEAQSVTFADGVPTTAKVGERFAPAATSQSGGPVTFSTDGPCTLGSDGSVTFTGAGDCSVTATAPATDLYDVGSATVTVTVTKRGQTVGFTTAPPASAQVGDTAPVEATSSSLLPTTLTAGPADVCSVTDGTLSLTGEGTCTTTAAQSGDATYAASPDATVATTVSKVPQTVGFTSPAPEGATVGGTYTPATTGGASSNPVTLSVDGPCALDEGTVTFTGRGTCTVTAAQAGDQRYAAGSELQMVAVGVSPSDLTLTVEARRLTASVTSAAGAPTGDVVFTVDGDEIGRAPLTAGDGGSTATLPLRRGDVPAGAARDIRATYAPAVDSPAAETWGGSTDDYLRTDPTVTATVTSSGRMNAAGWYNRPVTVSFSCTAGSSPLSGPCPGPVNRRNTRTDFAAERTVSGADGGEGTVTVPVRVDARGPVLDISQRGSAPYARSARPVQCLASDGLSGLAGSCRVTWGAIVRGPQGGLRRSWTATATDVAGNTSTRSGHIIVRR